MKNLYIFKTGERFFGESGAMFMPIGGQILKTVSLKKATQAEIDSLIQNPQNDTLISQIEKRG